jgi:hypothetical protein
VKRVKQHKGHFLYQEKTIEYSFWSDISDGQKPDVVIFLGAGQTGAIVRMVAERAGTGVVVIGGVPHWHARSDAQDIADFTIAYFESAYRSVLTTFGCASMHILAESQAAPVAIILAGKLKEVKNLGLIRPLGFSVQAFGNIPETRLKTFRRRILRTSLQYPQSFLYDPRNLVVGLILIRAMLREASLSSLNEKYAVGVSYDSLQDLEQAVWARHNAGHTINFILGKKDKMFPPDEIMVVLKSLRIPYINITVVPSVSHSSLATRGSRKVLSMALEAIRTQKKTG